MVMVVASTVPAIVMSPMPVIAVVPAMAEIAMTTIVVSSVAIAEIAVPAVRVSMSIITQAIGWITITVIAPTV